MGYIIKGLTLIFVLSLVIISSPNLIPLHILGLLLLAALFIIRQKYYNHPLLMVPEALTILILAQQNPVYLGLFTVTAYDLAAIGLYPYLIIPALSGLFLITNQDLVIFFALITLAGISGYQHRTQKQRAEATQEVYDRERRIRYSLEEAKNRLAQAAKEATHLAEIRERNRIARDIHDHVGHSLAGILLQLQVIKKTLPKDPEGAASLLQNSITHLAASVDTLRETVHNIKPRELLGLDYLTQTIANFKFCPVDFKHSGDFNSITPSHLEIISSILKEALTNTARHSQASSIQISLEVRENITRLFYQDNGAGCSQIKEGLGISGMKERVQNAGGTISFDSTTGFMIVCVLPRDEYKGGAILEGSGSR